MIRVLAVVLVCVLSGFATDASYAQWSGQEQARLDSLTDIQGRLGEEMRRVEGAISRLQSKKDSLAFVEMSIEGIEITTKQDAPFRLRPQLGGGHVATIPRGAQLHASDFSRGHWQIFYDGQSGYVYEGYVITNDNTRKFIELLDRVLQVRADSLKAVWLAREEASKRKRQARRDSTERLRLAQQREDSLLLIEHDKRLASLRKRGMGLLVHHLRFGINSAGGVYPSIGVENIGSKTIKYISFHMRPFNSVGDPVYDTTDGKNIISFKGVGPIGIGETSVYEYESHEPLFYSGTTSCIELRRVVVEHMDGSTFTYVNDLKHIRFKDNTVRLQGECQMR